MKTLRYISLATILLTVLVLAGATAPVMAFQSAPTNQVDAALIEDFHCSTLSSNRQICGTTKVNGTSLRLQASAGAPAFVVILRYNVATPTSWAIAKARLNLALGYTGSCVPFETVQIKVWSTANGDADPPQRGDFLADVNSTAPTMPNYTQVPQFRDEYDKRSLSALDRYHRRRWIVLLSEYRTHR